MNLEVFNRVTNIELRNVDMFDFQRVNRVLTAAVGGVRVFGGAEARSIKLEWNHFDMSEYLNKPTISVMLAEQLALIPEASPQYLELIEHIIDDWKTVDRTIEHGQSERCAQVIEMLAKKRDEIRENLREEPYLNAPVSQTEGEISLGEPMGAEAFNAVLRAVG